MTLQECLSRLGNAEFGEVHIIDNIEFVKRANMPTPDAISRHIVFDFYIYPKEDRFFSLSDFEEWLNKPLIQTD